MGRQCPGRIRAGSPCLLHDFAYEVVDFLAVAQSMHVFSEPAKFAACDLIEPHAHCYQRASHCNAGRIIGSLAFKLAILVMVVPLMNGVASYF